MLNCTRIELKVPCKKPFRILLAGDTHLIHVDEQDDLRKQELAVRRVRDFGPAEEVQAYWDETIRYANENCNLFLHAGDLIDFVSHKNCAVMKESLASIRIPLLMAAGNHEFSQYVGEAKEDDAYKAQSFEQIQSAARNHLDFASLQLNGINFIAIDNSYYLFKKRHLLQLKDECKKGFPIILLLHNPLFSEGLHDLSRQIRKQPCTYLCGVPDEYLIAYPPARREQQTPDEPTLKMLDFLRAEPLIKGIFAGHLHYQITSTFTRDIPQIVTGGNYNGAVTELFIRNPE